MTKMHSEEKSEQSTAAATIIKVAVAALLTGGVSVAQAVTPSEFNANGTIGTVSDWQNVTGATNGDAGNSLIDIDGAGSYLIPTGSSFTHYNWTITANAGVTNDSSSNAVLAGTGFFSSLNGSGGAGSDNYLFITDSASGQGSVSITVNFPSAGAANLNYSFARRRTDYANFDGRGRFDILLDGVAISTDEDSTAVLEASFHNRDVPFTVSSAGDHVIMFRMQNYDAPGTLGEHTVLLDNMTLTGVATPVSLQSFSVD